MQCTHPVHIRPKGWPLWKCYAKFPPLGTIKVPCGKCVACKINRSREWALRISHELPYWDHSCFLTLTFDDKHLPNNNSINKRDLQLFFKRLRKTFSSKPIKYYACGEYGQKSGRPHYHIILFGLSNRALKNEISTIWPFGLVHIGNVTYESARYVAGYIDKKYSPEYNEEIYLNNGLNVPFQLASTKLGLRACIANSDQFKQNLSTSIKGRITPLPRYYKKKLDLKKEDYDSFLNHLYFQNLETYSKLGMKNIDELQDFEVIAARGRETNLKALSKIRATRKKI